MTEVDAHGAVLASSDIVPAASALPGSMPSDEVKAS